jgi:hypothetical protein
MFVRAHFDLIEAQLAAMSALAGNASHPVIKGIARENFFRGFLRDHFGGAVGVGSGEIFDLHKKPGDPANQIDVVLFDQRFLRLDFGGVDNSGFLVESVYACVEVKTRLDRKEMEKAIRCATNLMTLERQQVSVASLPQLPCYLIAFDGPKIDTVAKWLMDIENTQRAINPPQLFPRSLAGIFVLGKGLILDCGIAKSAVVQNKECPPFRWLTCEQKVGNLCCLVSILNHHVQYILLKEYFGDLVTDYRLVDWNEDRYIES